MNRNDVLLGELREFRRHALFEIQELRSDVKELKSFKSRLIGMSMVAVFLSTLIIEMIRR